VIEAGVDDKEQRQRAVVISELRSGKSVQLNRGAGDGVGGKRQR
jgi:hypothetical protein